MIENTGARDPFVHLIGAMSDGTEKYITDMEAAGQQQLVASEDLPTQINTHQQSKAEVLAELTALGFRFGEPHTRDPLFRPARLPQGWKRQASDHSMWSHIVDELGRKRVAIFYKAAYYDRDAFMSLETVFSYISDLAYRQGKPVLDNRWATPGAVAEAARGVIKRANETVELYDQDRYIGDKYATERLAEVRKEIAWAEALIAEVAAS